VTFNRACGDEECLGNLAVGQALAGKLGDPELAGRQRIDSCQNDAARPGAGGAELDLGLFGDPAGSDAVGCVEGIAEELSRFRPSVAPPKHCPEVDESSCSFQSRLAVFERVNGLAEQLLSAITAGHDAGGAARHANRAGRTERPCKLELFT